LKLFRVQRLDMSVNVALLDPLDFLESKDRLDMLEGLVLMALLAKVKEIFKKILNKLSI